MAVDRREKTAAIPYKDHASMAGDRCLYCQGFGDQVDHYPPVAQARYFTHWPQGFRIRACLTCNWNLSDSVQSTLAERKEAALVTIEARRIPPRFKSKKDRDDYNRMERIMFCIARRLPIQNADDLLNELIGESSERDKGSAGGR